MNKDFDNACSDNTDKPDKSTATLPRKEIIGKYSKTFSLISISLSNSLAGDLLIELGYTQD